MDNHSLLNTVTPITDESFRIIISIMEHFFDLSKELKAKLRLMLFEINYDKGSNILNPGAKQDIVWFVLDGLLREISVNKYTLKEYFKNPGNLVDIKRLEKQLYSAVLKAGIPKQNFTINDISSYNMTSQKQKNPDFAVRKQYRVKMGDVNKINAIIEGVDPKAIEYTQIEGYDYSKLETLKKEIKIRALKDAKNKASYLAEAGESKLGKLLEMQESGTQHNRQASNMMETAAVAPQSMDQSLVVNFK